MSRVALNAIWSVVLRRLVRRGVVVTPESPHAAAPDAPLTRSDVPAALIRADSHVDRAGPELREEAVDLALAGAVT